MNLLQMNRQKNESACGIPFIFLVYLTGGDSESVAFFCIFFVKRLTKADCLPGHFPGEGRFSPNFAKKKKGVDKFLLLW